MYTFKTYGSERNWHSFFSCGTDSFYFPVGIGHLTTASEHVLSSVRLAFAEVPFTQRMYWNIINILLLLWYFSSKVD